MGTRKARKAKDPIRKDADQLLVRLAKARREEEVKAAWAGCFGLEYDTTHDHDLYTEQVLFEFKLQRNFDQANQRAATLAQLLYYVRRLKLDGTAKGIPANFCLADKTTAVLGTVADWRDLYSDAHGRYDWDLAPSSPDPLLVAAVQAHERFVSMRVYHLALPEEVVFVVEHLGRLFSPQARLDFGDRKAINEDNFEDVYAYWNEVFGESVSNGFKPSRHFVADIQKGRSRLDAAESKIYFHVGDGEDVKVKRVLARDHEHFWSLYDKVIDPAVMRGIVTKIDRLTDDVDRRKQGEFFTPLLFARKALDYIEREVGARWWEDGRTRLWDMAAGTGNLQYHLPAAALEHCYLSTLYPEDVEHCSRLFPGATVFQYDYLNDDVGNVFDGDNTPDEPRLDFGGARTWKLPQRLRDELQNPNLRWIVLINPPFATAQKGGATGANKADVSMTRVRQVMQRVNWVKPAASCSRSSCSASAASLPAAPPGLACSPSSSTSMPPTTSACATKCSATSSGVGSFSRRSTSPEPRAAASFRSAFCCGTLHVTWRCKRKRLRSTCSTARCRRPGASACRVITATAFCRSGSTGRAPRRCFRRFRRRSRSRTRGQTFAIASAPSSWGR